MSVEKIEINLKSHRYKQGLDLCSACCPFCTQDNFLVDFQGDISLQDVCNHWVGYSGDYFYFSDEK